MKKPFPAPNQSIKWPALERNTLLALWLIFFFSIFMAVTSQGQILQASARGNTGKGDNVLIAGFVLKKDGKVAIRALGPSLPLSGKLLDPTLELRDSKGVLKASNDNYVSTVLPPTNKKESSIVADLKAGSWTVIVRGKGNSTGVALAEVYDITSTPTPIPTATPAPTLSPTPSPTASPTPVPVTQRDVMINWTIASGDASRIVDTKVCWSLNGIETCKMAGTANSVVLPKLKIGARYRIVVIPILETGPYGSGVTREHFLKEFSCIVTQTGCVP